MLFEGGVRAPPNFKNLIKMNPKKATTEDVVEMILEQADILSLRTEVRSTAIAILQENPNMDTGSAYLMAAIEWDVT